MQPEYGAPQSGERWNVNMPAVIGVVFVFLVGVVVWVVVSSTGDDDPDQAATPTTSIAANLRTSTSTDIPPESTTPPTLSPTPLPSTVPPTDPTTSTSSTTTPATTEPAPATTAPGSEEGTVPGDLAVPGRPMQRPPCDGAYITVLASPIGAQATADGIAAVLEQYPGSNYLRADQTCPSLNPSSNGEPIYVIFFGPFAFDTDACTARADGPDDAYARRLSDELTPQHSVACA